MSAEPKHFAVSDVIRFPGGQADHVVIEPISGRVLVLSAEEERVLGAVRGEQTLEQHAKVAAPRLGRPPEALRGLLQLLAMKGLLLESTELRAIVRRAVRQGDRAAGPVRLATLGVPTNGRIAGLVECLRGHAGAARERGRDVTCVVADSSAGETAGATRAALEALSAAGVSIRYAGLPERARYAPILAARAGVDPALVSFALFGDARYGSDTGANRNALLLDSAGEALLMTDDDVRSRAVLAPEARAAGPGSAPYSTSIPFGAGAGTSRSPTLGLPLLLSSVEPYEAWFVDPDQPVVAADRWEAPDVLALHEALLGADVAAAILDAEGPSGAGLSLQAGAVFFQRLVRRGGRVVTTQLGCAGDHGMGASFSMMLFGGATRGRLLASEARFEDAFRRRRILRSPVRATISDASFCMSMSLGVDARRVVPPFAPAGRNSDGLFGVTMRACVPDAFTGFLPWAVEHVPPGERTTSFEHERAIAGRAEVNDFVRMALGSMFDPRGASAASNLADAGRLVERLAGRPREAEHLFREQVMRGLARRLAQMERLQAEHGRQPAFWSRALDSFGAAMRAALVSSSLWLPFHLVKAHGEEAAREMFLRYLAEVGRLYEAWPALFEAARELRAEGVRLSEPLGATTT